MNNIVEGIVKKNSNNPFSKKLEGLKIVASLDYWENKSFIVYGTNENKESQPEFLKLTQAIYEFNKEDMGLESLETFRKDWKDGLIDGHYVIPKEDLEITEILVRRGKDGNIDKGRNRST
ncbi:hypothetical protein [Marinisporobacter balticus]|uniref:hypothetical protein n=1 Tax=Marinisporobacter balticus TaxID=2018667 RepID=UPI00104624A6|nr:hypothetical protein [Marinisporobacter balticus]